LIDAGDSNSRPHRKSKNVESCSSLARVHHGQEPAPLPYWYSVGLYPHFII